MKWLRIFLLIAGFSLSLTAIYAQEGKNIKFGKPRPEDFDLKGIDFDSGANAVVIADIGSSGFEGNIHGGFDMVYTRMLRVKILNKNGFDIADHHIYLYNNGSDGEKIKDLKGVTFNMENGKPIETRLDPATVFEDKLTRQIRGKKFTMPGLKEGSVFDLTYTITSNIYEHLRQWNFQGAYPRIWSEYTVTIPPAFHYVTQSVGSPHFDISQSKDVFQSFSIRESRGTESDEIYDVSGVSVQHRWVMKNVPAVKEETYLSTTDNYSPAVRFQLHYFQWNAQSQRHDRMSDWFMASKKLMEDEEFGKALTSDNRWMNAEMKSITGDATTEEQKMRRIFAYLRSGFTCTSHSGIYASASLKDVFKKKSGTAVEINLLLTALLRHEGISADPVLLSTRENGVAEQSYPMMTQFNYVICNAVAGGKNYHLDASHPVIGFGKLATDCYNGQGRMVNAEKPYLIDLYPDSVTESRITSVLLSNDEKGALSGSCIMQYGDAGSYALREQIKKTSLSDYFKSIRTGLPVESEITSTSIDSLDQYDFPATIRYEFKLSHEGEPDVIYFNPVLVERYGSNPFKAARRLYPVEMPYCIDETYLLSMEIPKGYIADEIPKSARLMLNENEGYFEYLIQKSDTQIQMRTRLKLKKADFDVEDYNTLREFYAYVVKKESEQIVFKKSR